MILVSKLLSEIKNFGKKYNFREIYSNFKVFKPEKSFSNSNLTDTDPTNKSRDKILTKMSIVINSNFNEICNPCMESK